MILALDVSGSMCATDVEPNRLTAAQAAVRDFVQTQDPSTRIGLVLFSGFAQVAVAPTTDREPLLRAIDSLTTGRGTTIGAAILKSVDAIAEINPDVAPADPGPASAPVRPARRRRLRRCRRDGAGPPPPRAPGTFAPEIVVLLTDGAQHPRHRAGGGGRRSPPSAGCGSTRSGSAPATRRRWSARRPSWAAGVSTASAAGRGGGGGPATSWSPTRRRCRRWPTATGGEYFAASDADRLQSVLEDLPRTCRPSSATSR